MQSKGKLNGGQLQVMSAHSNFVRIRVPESGSQTDEALAKLVGMDENGEPVSLEEVPEEAIWGVTGSDGVELLCWPSNEYPSTDIRNFYYGLSWLTLKRLDPPALRLGSRSLQLYFFEELVYLPLLLLLFYTLHLDCFFPLVLLCLSLYYPFPLVLSLLSDRTRRNFIALSYSACNELFSRSSCPSCRE